MSRYNADPAYKAAWDKSCEVFARFGVESQPMLDAIGPLPSTRICDGAWDLAAATCTPTPAPSSSPSPASSSGWHWTDPGVHSVDGWYVVDDRACPMDGSDNVCASAIKVGTLTIGHGRVIAATMARPPMSWVGSDGRTHADHFGGLMAPAFVLLTLDSGTRRAVSLLCQGNMYGNASYPPSGDVTTGEGGAVLVEPGRCQSQPEGGAAEWRVGAPEPIDYMNVPMTLPRPASP